MLDVPSWHTSLTRFGQPKMVCPFCFVSLPFFMSCLLTGGCSLAASRISSLQSRDSEFPNLARTKGGRSWYPGKLGDFFAFPTKRNENYIHQRRNCHNANIGCVCIKKPPLWGGKIPRSKSESRELMPPVPHTTMVPCNNMETAS